MAFPYKLRNMPVEGDYFLTFKALLKVIRDASIKHKFFFKVLYKDIKEHDIDVLIRPVYGL
jgi:hypothetical protein